MGAVKNVPDPSRVKRFEGMRVDDLVEEISVRPIEYIPIIYPLYREFTELLSGRRYITRDALLANIKHLAAGGDPEQVDPGLETVLVAGLFSSGGNRYPSVRPFGSIITREDIDAYHYQYNYDYWEARRGDVIAKNYGLREGDPFYNILIRACVKYAPSFRGIPSFAALSGVLPDILPHVRETKRLSVLYPGAGFHVAPLVTAMQLIDRGVIDEARFTYTEIDESDHDYLTKILRLSAENGIFDSLSIGQWVDFGANGREQGFVAIYKGRPIRIVFALNRSGEAYYRDEYLEDTDLVVIHDPKSGPFEGSTELLAKILLTKAGRFAGKEQAVIIEGKIEASYDTVENSFPAWMRQWELPGPYGHCDGPDGVGEVEKCAYETARVFRLDDPLLMELTSRHYGDYIGLSREFYKPPPRASLAQ